MPTVSCKKCRVELGAEPGDNSACSYSAGVYDLLLVWNSRMYDQTVAHNCSDYKTTGRGSFGVKEYDPYTVTRADYSSKEKRQQFQGYYCCACCPVECDWCAQCGKRLRAKRELKAKEDAERSARLEEQTAKRESEERVKVEQLKVQTAQKEAIRLEKLAEEKAKRESEERIKVQQLKVDQAKLDEKRKADEAVAEHRLVQKLQAQTALLAEERAKKEVEERVQRAQLAEEKAKRESEERIKVKQLKVDQAKLDEKRKADEAVAEHRANNWLCQSCGIQGVYLSKDTTKCSTKRKTGQAGCCNCAVEHHGWHLQYLDEGCLQCKARNPELVAQLEIEQWHSQQLGHEADAGCSGWIIALLQGRRGYSQVHPGRNPDLEALWNAAKRGKLTQAKLLVAQNVNVLERHRKGQTALHMAAKRGHADVALVLAEAGGLQLLTAKTERGGHTALELALFYKHYSVTDELRRVESRFRQDDDTSLQKEREFEAEVANLSSTYDPASGLLSGAEHEAIIRSILSSSPAVQGANMGKFTSSPRELVCGEFEHAAKGLFRLLQVDEDEMTQRNVQGMKEEVAKLGDSVVSEHLEYVLFHAASEKEYVNGVRDSGNVGMRLADFAKHQIAQESQLTIAEVAALRLYTTPAFKAINDPLRDQKRVGRGDPHSLPVTVTLISRGIKKLRSVGAGNKAAVSSKVLWRGMKDVVQSKRFTELGGTELAPMSTTTSFETAVSYALSKESLLFRIVTNNSLQRGADLKWLSAFPAEDEVLYSPLTYMQPTGRQQEVEIKGCKFTIVEVQPSSA